MLTYSGSDPPISPVRPQDRKVMVRSGFGVKGYLPKICPEQVNKTLGQRPPCLLASKTIEVKGRNELTLMHIMQKK